MNKNTSETVHVYALFHSWAWRLSLFFLPLLGIAWTVLGMLTFLPSFHTRFGDALGNTVSGLVVLTLLGSFYRTLGKIRLVVTADGMTYYALGFRMYTPWKNVMGLERFHPYPFTILHARTFPGFQLCQNYRIHLKIAEGRQQEVAVLETSWWNPVWSMAPFAKRFPLLNVIVGYNWQERDFGRDVQQYAPWVFHDPSLQEISET